MSERPIRLLIADAQQLFRQGVTALFSASPEVHVVGEAADGKAAIDDALSLEADVVLMEIALPLIDGIAAARRIRMVKPSTEILFIAANHNEDQVRAAFEAGGRGFLLKDSDFEELLFAVKKTAIGEYYISGVAGPEMVAAYVQSRIAEQRPGGFMTRREREIAKLLSDGYSTREVADILNISVKTAETHRSSIMKKLNARNVTDIVKYCIRNRIIEL